ncbi:MAG: DNA mismatch repair endonuclease MutL, partial [Proteobacteria bacterium]|nr:DNA mismatch repair endonuclease MutL [Pseudomonadota bacterium]
LKFLKAETTEARRCHDVVMRIALAHPETAFTFSSNGRQLFALPKDQTLADRLGSFWPPAIRDALLPIDRRQGDYRLTGLTGSPAAAQGRGDRILLYVNGRPVQDKLLLSALRQAYSGRLLSKEYPQAVLFLTLPAELVDVNVHPAKLEVRFADESQVFTTVRQGLHHALAVAEGMPDASSLSGHAPGFGQRSATVSESRPGLFESSTASRHPHPSGGTSFEKYPGYREYATGPSNAYQHTSVLPPISDNAEPIASPATSTATLKQIGGFDYLGQVADTYLILRRGGSLFLVDQHAAHERILLAAMRNERTRGDSQPLAVPLEMGLHPSESARLQELWGELRSAGFLMETAGQDSVLLKGVPPTLDPGRAKDYFRAAVSSQAKNLDDLWAMLSCKAAIKAGQSLADDEALSLLETWLATPEREYCPHGRPIVVSWSPTELEKLFKRK